MESISVERNSVEEVADVNNDEANFEAYAPGKPLHSFLGTRNYSFDQAIAETDESERPSYNSQSSIAKIVAKSDSISDDDVSFHESPSFKRLVDELSDSTGTDEDPNASIDRSQHFELSHYIRQRTKHMFILSTAGKPIFSRHGNEEELSTFMGIVQALVSFVLTNNPGDELVSLCSGDWRCVFLHRPPLILVAASRLADSCCQLRQQVDIVYQQIISVLSLTQLTKAFENRTNFDLRRLLTGTERSFQHLLKFSDTNLSLYLNAVKIHPIPGSLRDSLGQAVAHYISKTENVVFGIVIANKQLVTVARMKGYILHPADLHLIINLVTANTSFKNAESWSPLCLPKFDSSGFLHAHISYLNDDCQACLLLLSVDRSAFFKLSDIKRRIVEKLNKNKQMVSLCECVTSRQQFHLNEVRVWKGEQIGRFIKRNDFLRNKQIGISDLWHFLYKNQFSHQFTCPAFDVPYCEAEAQQRVLARYLKVHHFMHSSKTSLKIIFSSTSNEAILGWITNTFELYAVFAPLTSKTTAIAKVNVLMKWLKKEENQLFILAPPVF